MSVNRIVVTITAPLVVGLAALAVSASPALAAAPEKPETKPASGETGTTAVLHGVLNPKAEAETGWYFAYSTGTECTSGGPGGGETAHEPPAKVKALAVEREVTGLEPNKAYKFCLVATNTAEEATVGNEAAFKTLPLAPVIAGEAASAVKSTGATLEAQINPDNEKTKYTFEYSTEESAGSLTGTIVKVPGAAELEGYPEQTGSVALSGLKLGETYFYRIVAENAQSETETKPVVLPVQSFTTVPVPSTGTPTAVTATTVVFHGRLKPLNEKVPTRYDFNYKLGNECASESVTLTGNAGTGMGTEEGESANVTDLQPNHEYTVCFVTSNESGFEEGMPVHFTTLALPPRIDSETISNVTPVEAILEAQVNPNNQKTTYTFEYATNQALAGATTVSGTALEGYGDQTASAPLTGLKAGETYYYRVVVENTENSEVVRGAIRSFTPQGPPLAITGAAQDVTSSAAVLSGTVNPAGTETTYHFAYVPATAYEPGAANPYAKGRTTPRSASVGSDYTAHPTESVQIGELQPNTTYDYALVATNTQEITTISANGSFTTPAAATPPPSTEPAATEASPLPKPPFANTPTPAFIPYTSIATLDATEAHENKTTTTTKKAKTKKKKKKLKKHRKHQQHKKK